MVTRQRVQKSKQSSRRTTSPKVSARAKSRVKVAAVGPRQAAVLKVAEVRTGLGLPRRVFARLSGYSERALAEWESGKPLSGSSRQRMIEMDRLRQALARVMKADFIGVWLQSPNDAFDGLKPLEVVERGEVDRLWQMIYLLESGQPG